MDRAIKPPSLLELSQSELGWVHELRLLHPCPHGNTFGRSLHWCKDKENSFFPGNNFQPFSSPAERPRISWWNPLLAAQILLKPELAQTHSRCLPRTVWSRSIFRSRYSWRKARKTQVSIIYSQLPPCQGNKSWHGRHNDSC